MTAPSIPPDAVIRVSRGDFDQSRFAEVEQMTRDTGDYLIPAIRRLDGLIGYSAGASPSGSIVHVSLWQSNDHADQMGGLKEMIIDARRDSEAVGVSFVPIINYPIAWETSAATETDEGAVIRVARNDWDPARFDQATEINERTSKYLVPAIRRLDGLIAFYAGVSPTGSLLNASIWRSTANAQQMDSLKEMIVDARNEFAAIGPTFNPIVNYPIVWSI
ncbi:MAG: hypothetical protein ACXVUE_21080 [Solirubrobacteraceae bacterium]